MQSRVDLRAVIDTNVLFEGLTKQGGACGLIIDAWLHALFVPCVSNALAYEYTATLQEHLSQRRWHANQPVLGILLAQAQYVPIYYTWRPSSPDPGDEHIIDCAMNASACVVTHNLRDFRQAERSLGLEVLKPATYISRLVDALDDKRGNA